MEIHDTEAPPVSELDVTAASSAAPAEGSPEATDVKEGQPSLLDVVKNVVEQTDTPEASSASDAEKKDPKEGEGDTAKAEEPENFDGLPFGRHPRFKAVLDERNSYRTQVKDLEARATELEGPANQYAAIERFMAANEIGADEMVNLFRIQALTKSDPEKALAELSPLLSDLYTRTGRLLPDDIRQDIEEGKITEDRGRELAKERARANEGERRAARATERAAEVEQSTAVERRDTAIETALTDWEATTKGKDPDFAAKEELIGDRCKVLIAERGHPKTAAEAKALIQQAYEDVNARTSKFAPARREMKRPPTNSSTTSNATALPKTLLEAVSIAAAEGR